MIKLEVESGNEHVCVGLVVLHYAAWQVWPSSEPPVEGILPLEVNMGADSIP